MSHEIIMPALGMNQDTGIILNWNKKPGDPINAEDILLEVETDKATVEVEAGYDGVLASVTGEIGVPIPLGAVIAIITATKEEAAEVARRPQTADPSKDNVTAPTILDAGVEPKPLVTEAPEITSPPPIHGALPASPANGRILASPKARRLAHERGIELQNLVSQRLPQPFHVADLEKLRPSTPATGSEMDEFSACVEAPEFGAFHSWAKMQSDLEFSAGRIWAAFSAASFRAVAGGDWSSPLCVQLISFGPDGEELILMDPDHSGLLGMRVAPEDTPIDLAVLDLTRTLLTNYRPGNGGAMPMLLIARTDSPDAYQLTLRCSNNQLPTTAAVEFLSGVVDRAHEPLRHLL